MKAIWLLCANRDFGGYVVCLAASASEATKVSRLFTSYLRAWLDEWLTVRLLEIA